MKINSTVPVWKPLGWTPLMVVEEFKKQNPSLADKTISYAGRLDPMAEGVLLLLIGDENKNRKQYEDLEKVYESEIVFGITTDSLDGLGIIQTINLKGFPLKEKIDKVLKNFLGKQNQIYPSYSSKAINGKPLFWWARNNKLSEIEIPKREIEIYSLTIKSLEVIKVSDLVIEIMDRIEKVKGDFRQENILKTWERFAQENKNKKLLKIKIQVKCSSGTYIRRLAFDIGESLGTGAFAFSIKRTSVGGYSFENKTLL